MYWNFKHLRCSQIQFLFHGLGDTRSIPNLKHVINIDCSTKGRCKYMFLFIYLFFIEQLKEHNLKSWAAIQFYRIHLSIYDTINKCGSSPHPWSYNHRGYGLISWKAIDDWLLCRSKNVFSWLFLHTYNTCLWLTVVWHLYFVINMKTYITLFFLLPF